MGRGLTGVRKNGLQAILRETKEELGIILEEKEIKLFSITRTEDDFIEEYYIKKDFSISKIQMQTEEVSDVKWMKPKEIEEIIQKNQFSDLHIPYWKELKKYRVIK